MPKRVLLIQGHPDARAPHLGDALADAYAAGVQEGGGPVRRLDLATLDFPLLRSQDEFTQGSAPQALAQAQADIAWCEHLVLFFPLWLGGAPALVQAFLEQTLRPGFAFRYLDGGKTEILLRGRSARLVVTMGMPTLIYRWWFRAHGVRRISRSVLGFVGFSPVRETLFGMVEQASDAKRQGWLAQMKELGRRAA